MKKSIYILLLALVVISGIVLAKRQNENKNTEKVTSKALATAATTTAFQNWEATPEAIDFRKWQNSSEGKNVLAAAASIAKHVKDSSAMHAIVTSLTLPPGSRLGYGILVSINSNSYILSFTIIKYEEAFFFVAHVCLSNSNSSKCANRKQPIGDREDNRNITALHRRNSKW